MNQEEILKWITQQPEVARLSPVLTVRKKVVIGNEFFSVYMKGEKAVIHLHYHPSKGLPRSFGLVSLSVVEPEVEKFAAWFTKTQLKVNHFVLTGQHPNTGRIWNAMILRRSKFKDSLSPAAKLMLETSIGKKIKYLPKAGNFPVKIKGVSMDEEGGRRVINLLAELGEHIA